MGDVRMKNIYKNVRMKIFSITTVHFDIHINDPSSAGAL